MNCGGIFLGYGGLFGTAHESNDLEVLLAEGWRLPLDELVASWEKLGHLWTRFGPKMLSNTHHYMILYDIYIYIYIYYILYIYIYTYYIYIYIYILYIYIYTYYIYIYMGIMMCYDDIMITYTHKILYI